ncbi:MAG: hypothetical protein WC444_04910 [Candidatus Paceibacterota bacterium]
MIVKAIEVLSICKTAKKFTVYVFHTRGDIYPEHEEEVQATNLESACKQVSDKFGYKWIGKSKGNYGFFAVDVDYFNEWHGKYHDTRKNKKEDLEKELNESIETIKSGRDDEFRGLMCLCDDYNAYGANEEDDDD